MKLKLLLLLTLILSLSISINANEITYSSLQEERIDTIREAPDNWFNLDIRTDNILGVSTEKAYKELLKNKKSKTIIVAILDSGIDTDHEDLKNKIWVNDKEIAGNGIDDDKNGYIDDINGWNFIGGKEGTHVHFDTWEVTRLYKKYKTQFEGKNIDSLSEEEKIKYEEFLTIEKDYKKQMNEAKLAYNNLSFYYNTFLSSENIVVNYLKKKDYTIDDLKAIEPDNDSLRRAIQFITYTKNKNLKPEDIKEGYDEFEGRVKYKLNLNFDPRDIVGDDYENKTEKYYGNNNVKGPDPFHGTHVAGIIGADRNNNKGIKGIADNVEFMVLRMCPSGDERDKDVANSIYYAVDNGAKIINMSFGKAYSPYKEIVDKAFKYADKHGVLIVHAAGNDSENNDKVYNYPNRKYLNSDKECNTWLEVGASSWKSGDKMIGRFTNYGKENVDLFAPGVDIYSTAPEKKYKEASGTSMAAPVVSGVAALVWSYYPDLTVMQLKKVLLSSVMDYKDNEVICPGKSDEKIKFGELSKTGGIINAYNAIMNAEKIFK